jgi:hypothetical protein
MGKSWSLARLSSGAFVAALAVAGFFIDGIAEAAPTANIRQVAATGNLNIIASTSEPSVQQGQEVVATAIINIAEAGSVQFIDGTVALGNRIPIRGGTATAFFSTSTFSVGEHLLRAVFIPTYPSIDYSSLTSGATLFTVSAPSGMAAIGRKILVLEPADTEFPSEQFAAEDIFPGYDHDPIFVDDEN